MDHSRTAAIPDRVAGRTGRLLARQRALLAIAVLGMALAAAPVAFQMFTRAPDGGDMIADFRPYMTVTEIDKFRGYLDLIGAADAEATDTLIPVLVDAGAVSGGDAAPAFPSVDSLQAQWPGIDADMTDLLDTMDTNLGNFDSVSSLPPFALFPWFFVVPGLIVAVTAIVTWFRVRAGGNSHLGAVVLIVVGVGILVAPAMFQMFSRAPDGADMIDDFRPMMTQERVTRVQGYFITMGGAEGGLRNQLLPAVEAVDPTVSTDAAAQFSAQWPTIVGEFAPMVATMSDNVDNFAGIDALPPFGLFPWFFVFPGLGVVGLGVFVARSSSSPSGRKQS